MAFLEINGWAVPVFVESWNDSRDDVEARARQFDGSIFLDTRSQHSGYSGTTPPITAAVRDALRHVIQGDGQHWDFEGDSQYGSRGLGILSGQFGFANGGKFGFFLEAFQDVTFETAFGTGAPWTVAYWRDESFLDWHHIIVTSDGRKWRDGVRNDAEPTTELTVTSEGNVVLADNSGPFNGWYDDLVTLPYAIIDEQGDTWPQSVPYSDLPRLQIDGDGIPDGPVEALGNWQSSTDVPTPGATQFYRAQFLLQETGGGFRASPTGDADPVVEIFVPGVTMSDYAGVTEVDAPPYSPSVENEGAGNPPAGKIQMPGSSWNEV